MLSNCVQSKFAREPCAVAVRKEPEARTDTDIRAIVKVSTVVSICPFCCAPFTLKQPAVASQSVAIVQDHEGRTLYSNGREIGAQEASNERIRIYGRYGICPLLRVRVTAESPLSAPPSFYEALFVSSALLQGITEIRFSSSFLAP